LAWLERFLKDLSGTVLAISMTLLPRQRRGLDFELDRGHGYSIRGNYSSWLEAKKMLTLQTESKTTASHPKKAIKFGA